MYSPDIPHSQFSEVSRSSGVLFLSSFLFSFFLLVLVFVRACVCVCVVLGPFAGAAFQ